jgi:hypothetical protein
MVAITRKIGDLTKPLRQALEAAAGAALADEQQVVIQIDDGAKPPLQPTNANSADNSLPDWCRVYEGFSESELAAIDAVVGERAVLARATP